MICSKCGTHIRNSSNAHLWEEGPVSTYLCHECYQEENDYYEEPDNEPLTIPEPPKIERTFRVILYRDVTQRVEFVLKDTNKDNAIRKARERCKDIDDGEVTGEKIKTIRLYPDDAEVID